MCTERRQSAVDPLWDDAGTRTGTDQVLRWTIRHKGIADGL
jgi:hypothetical protein